MLFDTDEGKGPVDRSSVAVTTIGAPTPYGERRTTYAYTKGHALKPKYAARDKDWVYLSEDANNKLPR